MRRPTIEKEKTIARIMKKKEEEEEDLIELRATEKMVPQRFHKYLKVFEKKNSERILTRKAWDYAIDLREGFVPKKGKCYGTLNTNNFLFYFILFFLILLFFFFILFSWRDDEEGT